MFSNGHMKTTLSETANIAVNLNQGSDHHKVNLKAKDNFLSTIFIKPNPTLPSPDQVLCCNRRLGAPNVFDSSFTTLENQATSWQIRQRENINKYSHTLNLQKIKVIF